MDWLIDWFNAYMVDWWIAWLIGWCFDWLIDWCLEKHKNYHMKDEQLNKDGFKKFMKQATKT